MGRLAFDRSLVGPAGDGIVIDVVYRRTSRESQRVSDAAHSEPRSTDSISHLPTRFVALHVGSDDDLAPALAGRGIGDSCIALSRSLSLSAVTAFFEPRRVVTITGVAEHVDEGVAAGLGERGGRPEILLNREASRPLGMDFSSRLLQVAALRQ